MTNKTEEWIYRTDGNTLVTYRLHLDSTSLFVLRKLLIVDQDGYYRSTPSTLFWKRRHD